MPKFELRELNAENFVNLRSMQRFPGEKNLCGKKTAVKNASESGRRRWPIVAKPICKCRWHKAGRLQVRVAAGRRWTCVLKEARLNQGMEDQGWDLRQKSHELAL